MPAGRFIMPAHQLVTGTEIELPDEIAHQARDVLRLAPGAALTLLDGAGGEWPARVSEVGRAGVRVRLGARQDTTSEPRAHVALYVGMLKGAKLELVLQKGTELGVAEFVPI